ncbi:Prkg1 [Symbiodinium necroappetens]|uniref:Prkg1 protein n=1 Tax=Symbiodinium necroappetens TaxID=1628268 RepID=A0A812IVM7_9DINO|nr:Prkg1 [Symbiodinium necroappetens]
MWVCESTRDLRRGLRVPDDRLEERLLAMAVPEIPPAPEVIDPHGLYEDMAEVLQKKLSEGAPVLVATDGSVVATVAAWAVVAGLDGDGDFSLGLDGEDQTSHRAEVEGILALLHGLSLTTAKGIVHVMVDCQSALEVIAGGGEAKLLCKRARDLLDGLARRIEVLFWWVPSHGKCAPSRWQVPPCGEPVARALNARADRVARSCAGRRAGLAVLDKDCSSLDGGLVGRRSVGYDFGIAPALSKGFVVKSGMQKSVMSERDVQLACDSSFIIKVYETFNSSEHLYFLLECALGGELYATYNKKGLTGKEGHAKFYVAGVVVAFEHLHSKKIVFRDLKPENLLLNDHGHLKLTDMGLAKVVIGKTFTTCGTPDYFAPEMIASKGHTLAVDWWTLGVLGYELMCGNPPFEAEQVMQTYQKIKKGIAQVGFPPRCRGRCEDLIKNLCQKDPSERLPMRSGGIENIKKHIWYEGFDWQSFESLKMETPYKPEVKSKTDIANFSARDADRPPQVKYKDDGSGWDASFATSE